MLDKNHRTRISAQECLDHQWLKRQHFPSTVEESCLGKLRDFRAPKQIQLETLKFLVNNITMEIDFKTMREAFRAIDTSNTGIITLKQIQQGFPHDNYITHINLADVESLFKKLDIKNTGMINYSEFLAATVDKRIALTRANL